MNTNYKLALTLIVGVMIGFATGTVIHAQQTKAPPAFVVAEPIVSDPATFQKYAQQVPGTPHRSVVTTLFAAARSKPSKVTHRSASYYCV